MDGIETGQAALILKAVLSLGRRLRSQRPHGTPGLSTMSILGTLSRLGPMPAARLAEEEGLQPQSLSRIIAALDASGLIERRRSERDRREILLSVTPAGRRALSDDLAARRAWLKAAVAGTLTEEERQRLAEASELLLRLARFEG